MPYEPDSVGLNLMRHLTPDNPRLIEHAGILADGLVVIPEGKDPFWDQAARAFVRGVVLHVAVDEVFEGFRNLKTVRDILMLGRDLGVVEGKHYQGLEGLKIEMMASPCYAVQYAASELFSMPDRTRESIMGSLRNQLEWLDYPAMRDQVARDDFALEELRGSEACTIYLCLPVEYLVTASKWMRAIIKDTLRIVEETKRPDGPPLVALLDESALLEPMRDLQTASAYLPGFGCRFWQFYQSANQIDPKAMGVYRSNAGIVQLFGNGGDTETLAWLSKRCGKTTIRVRRMGEVSAEERRRGRTGITASPETVDLISGDEAAQVFGRHTGHQLIIPQHGKPMVIERLKYYDHPYFEGKYDDPA